MSGNTKLNRQKGFKSPLHRNRSLHMEALEERDLLSAAPYEDFQELRASCSDFNISEDANFIDVTELTVENLQAAIQQAAQTAEDDVIAVHTTQTSNSVALNGSPLVFDVDSELYGSITLASYGETILTISNTQENVVQVCSGEVNFSGISFLALESEGQSIQTDNLVVVSEDAKAAFSRTMFAVESLTPETSSALAASPVTSNYAVMQASSDSLHTYEASATFVNSSDNHVLGVYLTGLTQSDYNQLKELLHNGTLGQIFSENGGSLTGNFIDAEKKVTYDDNVMCWAAASANVLWYTGWAQRDANGNKTPFNSEDDVYWYFVDHFSNTIANQYSTLNAVAWFLSGTYELNGIPGFPQLEKSGGGFHPQYNSNNLPLIGYFQSVTDSGWSNLGALASMLEEGYGIGLHLEPLSYDGIAHAITAWGIVVDMDYEPTDPSFYKGLLITDSDNDRKTQYANTNAPNSLTYVELEWNGDLTNGYYILPNFYGRSFYLDSFAYLAPMTEYPNMVYNAHDKAALRSFLEQADSKGVKNGKKLNSSYNANNPATWEGVTWTEIDGEMRVTKINWNCQNNKQLVGALDVSNFTYLTVLKCESNKLTSLNASGCASLADIYCSLNEIATINVSGCSYLNVLSCWSSTLNQIEFDAKTATIFLWLENSDTNWTFIDANGITLLSDAAELYYYPSDFITFPVTAENPRDSQKILLVNASSEQLATPSLTVTSRDSNKALVTVNGVANCTSYKVEFSTDQNFAVSVKSKTVSAGASIINDLTTNTTYYFRVKAIGSGNYSDSDYSATTSVYIGNTVIVNDADCLRTFLEQADSSGVKNGTKLNSSYNSNDTSTWTGVTWSEINGTMRVTAIDWNEKQLVGALDLSACTELVELYCDYNQLTSVDVSKNTALEYLWCDSNLLTELNVSKNTALIELTFNNNQLTAIDVSKNTALKGLFCDSNNLTELNVSNNTSLIQLSCNSNQLTQLNVAKNTQLEYFWCAENQLTSLDLTKNVSLLYLVCNSNQLTTLDVSKNTALAVLECSTNQLTQLNISKNTALLQLYCSQNSLSSLDVSKNTELSILALYSNNVTSLNVSMLTGLNELWCWGNQLTSLDVSKNTALTLLDCDLNPFHNLDLSKNTALTTLACNSNQLTSLDLSHNPWLTSLECYSNNLTILDASSCFDLETLSCWNPNLERAVFSSDVTRLNISLEVPDSNETWTFLDANGQTLASNTTNYTYVYYNHVALPITAVNSSGTQTILFSNTLPEPLDVPSLNVNVTGPTSVSVWVSSVANASSFTLEYSTDPDFTVFKTKNVASGFSSVNDLSVNTTYYFRVKAIGSGNYSNSDYSQTQSEKTDTIKLDAPTLNVSANDNLVTVTVGSVENASGYTLEYAYNSQFSNSTTQIVTAGNSTVTLQNPNSTCYFRVKAIGANDYTDSNYSSVRTITIGDLFIAQNDFVKTTVNTPIVINYRANDCAPDEQISDIEFGKASNGSFVVNQDGTITYTPNDGFFGTDVIAYGLFSSSGKLSLASISINVGLPIVSSVQKAAVNHTPSTAMAPSVDSLTDWEDCYIELWAQDVNELNPGETSVTLEYNPAVYNAPVFSDCADGVALSVSQSVLLPNGNVQLELTAQISEAIVSQTNDLFLGTIALSPSTEKDSGVEADSVESVCVLNGSALTTTVESMSFDLVRDGIVNVKDFMAFASVFGIKPDNLSLENELYTQAHKADYNKDGIINVRDFMIFATNFGMTKKSTVQPISQSGAAADFENDSEIQNALDVTIAPEPVFEEQIQPLEPAAAAAIPVPENKSESSMTLREAYSAALLDLYDNQNRADLAEVSDDLADSRIEALLNSSDDSVSEKASNADAISAVLEEELLTIDWDN